jgi:putative transposase
MYHLVWTPKYRKRLLKDEIAERLKELFYQCAEVNDWKIEELNIQQDHIHMMIALKTTVSVSYAVQMLKGGSSKKIREEFPELEEFLWGDSFWNDGYFAETVGQKNEAAIRRYIQNQ